MRTISLHLNFISKWGEEVFVCGNIPEMGNNDEALAVAMVYKDEANWTASITLESLPTLPINYYYFVVSSDGTKKYNAIKLSISVDNPKKDTVCFDYWCSQAYDFTTLFTQPFSKIFLQNTQKSTKSVAKDTTHTFRVKAPQLKPFETVCIIGNSLKIGNWETEAPKLLKKEEDDYVARIHFPVELDKLVYKYGVYNTKTKTFVQFEDGNNRVVLHTRAKNEQVIIQDTIINIPSENWRGAGVAIPVFSLRSKSSFGVGEFSDIKLLATWCKKVGIKLIQLLPINDITVNKTNTDSYPYAANSSFALHPLYINLHEVGVLPADHKLESGYSRKQRKLNNDSILQYEAVIKYKLAYLKELFILDSSVLTSPEFETFFNDNKHWLKAFAAYAYLRDKNKTTDFLQWGKYATVDENKLAKLTDAKQKHYAEISFWYFVQYHLHTQLKKVVDNVRELGIAMKGDIPIGIGRTSCDAWQYPHLFNMDKQAGAPPDDFAVKGQNWGFPTYNWEAMQKDNFNWWKLRFEKMSDYFDAFRIDHILGFFRIWSIPLDAVEGIMGHFIPAIAVHKDELQRVGIYWDKNRYCTPFITDIYLNDLFGGEQVEAIKQTFFIQKEDGNYAMAADFDTQKKVADYFATTTQWDSHVQYKLYDCIANVLLFSDDKDAEHSFHFNIAMEKTYSFSQLNWQEQDALRKLYINYFYERQDGFWQIEANKKLPSIQHSTNMLICGEDLGMVPHCVPGVMQDLSILSLEVQRMPKARGASYVDLKQVPHLSVVTPSTHDMSTIRGWWEEDRDKTQQFYNQVLGHYGEAPQYCETWIVQQIIQQHLYSQSMLSIFQLQDLLAIDSTIRRVNPTEERINEPSNPNHYWCYRMHIKLEDLAKEKEFNTSLQTMIEASGR
jgi:4-alpha-glucanotransferase